jgi:flagellin
MSLVLNTNINALNAQNSLSSSSSQLSTALQQLSSGLRINTAADDAAGYAIVQGMTSQIGGLNQAARNASDGVSLAQTANGALQEITSDLQTMRNLAVQSLNATNSAQDRVDLDQQFQQLAADVDNVAKTANFNGVNLLDGSFNGQVFQTGANAGQTIAVSSIASARTSSLGAQYSASVASGALTATNTEDLARIVINGTAISSNVTPVTVDASVIATAINSANISGVSATAAANSVAGTTYAGAAGTGTLTINNVTTGLITVAGTGAATDEANVAAAINQISAATGVTATVTAGKVVLSNTTGANITVAYNQASGSFIAATTGVGAAGTTASTYTLNYSSPTGGNLVVTDASGHAGSITGTTAAALSGTSISNSNVQTVAASNSALSSIDAALNSIAATGAQLGAYQSRFQAAITGLNTAATNLTSARSSIQDTDYAAATSALSKAQILQQASTAMVAQANTVPQNVLTLLQKLP